jgi:hypothetical protein
MQITDFQTSLCYRKLRAFTAGRPATAGVLVIDGVVIAISTGLDMEVQTLVQFIEFFHLRLGIDLSTAICILEGGAQFDTFAICQCKHFAGVGINPPQRVSWI